MNKHLRRKVGSLPLVTGNSPADFLTSEQVAEKMRRFYRTLYKRMRLPVPAEYQ